MNDKTIIEFGFRIIWRIVEISQPRTQACSRYPSDQRRFVTDRDSARRPRRTFPTSLTGDVTSKIAEDDWERGWRSRRALSNTLPDLHNSSGDMKAEFNNC